MAVRVSPKARCLAVFLCVQVLVMAGLYQETCRRKVLDLVGILWKRNVAFTAQNVSDVYSNLSLIVKSHLPEGQLPDCPPTSPYLAGPIRVTFPADLTMEMVERRNAFVESGGKYKPPDCETVRHTAVIVPHRNREQHLTQLLYYLHPFLQRQQLHYGIYVIHQAGNATFNRAKLLNVGFKEAMRESDWNCLYYHDVDLIPENDRNLYVCERFPKHASVAMDKFSYKLPYRGYFGGVSALTPDHYMKINGFPNNYWGWGGEDDDIATRIYLNGMLIVRPSVQVGRYKMIKHKLDKGNEQNPKRFNMLAKTKRTWKLDGMNALEYTLISKEYRPMYTNISVTIGSETPPSNQANA